MNFGISTSIFLFMGVRGAESSNDGRLLECVMQGLQTNKEKHLNMNENSGCLLIYKGC